ncbi:MAG: hypothetical protein PWP70_30 [Moorella sp. (in: firmicutes)]|nr:hypothetical protein [Moorella sp. (in: firmicutes)]
MQVLQKVKDSINRAVLQVWTWGKTILADERGSVMEYLIWITIVVLALVGVAMGIKGALASKGNEVVNSINSANWGN